MIEDKIREEDQVEERERRSGSGSARLAHVVTVVTVVEDSKERFERVSPHVPEHAHGAATRRLDVLRDVIDEIVDERLIRIIREDDLLRTHAQKKKKNRHSPNQSTN